MGYGVTHFEVTGSNLVQTLGSEEKKKTIITDWLTFVKTGYGFSPVARLGSHITSTTSISQAFSEILPVTREQKEMYLYTQAHTCTRRMDTHV